MAHSISPAISMHRDARAGPAAADDRADDPSLRAEHRGRFAAVLDGVPAELREGERVERARGDLAHAETAEALGELAGGLAGERDGEHVRGRDALLLDEPRDPAGEHARLARAGRGQDRERRRFVGHGRALRRIEVGQEGVGPRRDPTDARRQAIACPRCRDGGREEAPSSHRRLRDSELLGAPASRDRLALPTPCGARICLPTFATE